MGSQKTKMGKSKIMNKKKFELTGKFLYCDVKNANGRIYTKKCVLGALEHPNEDIRQGNLLGELGYPDRPETSLRNVSHRVVDLKYNHNDNSLEGTIEILDGTPKGKELLKMINNDPKRFDELFVIRPRGTGIVNEKGEVENYTLYSFDIMSREKDAFNVREKPEEGNFKIE